MSVRKGKPIEDTELDSVVLCLGDIRDQLSIQTKLMAEALVIKKEHLKLLLNNAAERKGFLAGFTGELENQVPELKKMIPKMKRAMKKHFVSGK